MDVGLVLVTLKINWFSVDRIIYCRPAWMNEIDFEV